MKVEGNGWMAGRVFYTVVAAYYWGVTLYLDNLYIAISELPKGEWYLNQTGYLSYGGRYKYLTHWNLILQRAYFSIACIAFLLKYNHLRSVTKFLFNSLILPLSMIVTTMFWILYSIDRDLIFPKFYDEIYPWWVNHALHSFCALISLTELMMFPFPVPQKLKWEKTVPLLMVAAYTIWVVRVKYINGVWPYIFLRKLSDTQVAIFLFLCSVVLFFLYWVGVQLRRLKWGRYSIRVQYEDNSKLD